MIFYCRNSFDEALCKTTYNQVRHFPECATLVIIIILRHVATCVKSNINFVIVVD